jgi:pectinesterase
LADPAGTSVGFTRRELCGGLIAAALAAPASATNRFDAIVRKHGGTHASLATALADAPPDGRRWSVLIGRGAWHEKLVIARPNVELIGEDRHETVIAATTASGHERPDGQRWGTYGSATLTVEAPGFTARDLTIVNGFDYLQALRSGVPKDRQAVALALGNAADRSLLERVNLIGHQDTFYLRAGRALVRDCFITGSVDFIFGGAAARLERCEIRSRLRPGETLQGYVAAPSTPRTQPVGLVFDRCRLTRESGVPDGSVYLGRPWRAGGNMELLGAAAFLDCWMDAHIHPDGWTFMNYRRADGSQARLEAAEARLLEYRSRGPGAKINPARRQMSAAQLPQFSRSAMFGDWSP